MYLKILINNSYSDRVSIEYVQDGESGSSVTISSIEYVIAPSGSSTPSSGWNPNFPDLASQEGNWLWTKTTYSDGSAIYSSTYIGKDGLNGQDGHDGQDAIIYTCSIDSSAGTVINTANISTGSTTTITGHVYKIVGSNAPEEVIQNITYTWYKKNQVSPIANTKSFQFSLDGNWEEVQIYFEAVINGAS